MSKSLNSQNLKLLQAVHPDILFFRNFCRDHLSELANKANLFVFSNGSVLAQEKQEIDYLGIVIEGKVIVSGEDRKKGPGFIFGHLAMFNLLNKHPKSIVGDSDGIILAVRFSEVAKLKEQVRNCITENCLKSCLETLKGEDSCQNQWVDQEERKVISMYPSHLKTFFSEQIDEKQKKIWLQFFPWKIVLAKDLVIGKSADPYLIFVLKGELIVKKQSGLQTLNAGRFYNIEGFLTNFTTNANIFCISEQATVMIINRASFLRILKSITFYKFSCYLLRQEVNNKNYDIQTYQKRKEKQSHLTANKWSVFSKSNQFEILPLNIPRHMIKQMDHKSKPTVLSGKKDDEKQFMGTFFKEQLLMKQSNNFKTNSSNSSKFTRIVTMKTQKNQSLDRTTSSETQLKTQQKQLQQLQAKLSFYQQNYVNLKLEMIEYQSKYQMNAVFKQIKQIKDRKHSKNLGKHQANQQNSRDSTGIALTGTTLKNAFEDQLRENRIMEVVARCAYKWLWTVRRKKRKAFTGNGSVIN